MADQIADMLTRIRNATRSGRVRVDVPVSRLKADIAKILENEGYIGGFKQVELRNPRGEVPLRMLRISLKYGPRGVFYARDKAPPVLAGLGTSILTTSRGVMTRRQAEEAGVGGEVLCNVW